MFRSLCGNLLRWNGDSTTHFYFLQIKSISHIPKSTIQEPSSTVDYLVNSCGLSPESALRAAQQIDIKTATKPDSVLELFGNYGFTNTHIAKLITKHPSLLLADPNKTLKPKLEFFRNNGISDPILAKILCADPVILRRSLENQIIPSFNFLKRFLHTNQNIAFSLGRTTWILHNFPKQNTTILRNHGVPETIISKMIMTQPRTLCFKPDKLSETVLKTIEMGFDPSSLKFVYGLCTLSRMKKGAWEAKLAVYMSFGWSEDEILSMFRKQPNCMAFGEEDQHSFEFLHEHTELDTGLYFQGLRKKGNMGKALKVTEDEFLKNYVVKYQEDLPQLLKIYQTKMGAIEDLPN
ncbi:hypothetical protein HHK36_019537 [Tetracentron sinense]|uniref:Mitochondrial transcription termination factor n=1 Tax=Tetracentron sinense TaxID=13715 RepID=A0A834Z2D4_TETSI|nr:hypothetical protein HHK36_019537 [Tetracentron sinense]